VIGPWCFLRVEKVFLLGGWFLLGVLVIGTMGCSGSAKTIHAKNDSAPAGLVRLGFGDAAHLRVELGAVRTQGEFSQRLNEGDTVSTGEGEEITGPARLDGDADIDFLTLLFKRAIYPNGGSVGLEGSVGIAYSSSWLQLGSVRSQLYEAGVGGGFAFLLRPKGSRVGMRAGMSLYGIGQSDFQQHELLGSFRLAPNIEIVAGFHAVKLRFNASDPLFKKGDSDVVLDYSGPTVGVIVGF
jgi:hypothetical protein